MPEYYITVREAATQIKVSKMTIYRLIEAGELPVLRIGRSMRIPAAAWDAYLDAHSR